MLPSPIKFICGLTLRICCPNTLSFNEIHSEYIYLYTYILCIMPTRLNQLHAHKKMGEIRTNAMCISYALDQYGIHVALLIHFVFASLFSIINL